MIDAALAELAAVSDERLVAAARSGEWPLDPQRLRLDTPERLAAARAAIAGFARNDGADLWREPGARERGVLPLEIGARRLTALAAAWQRLGGGPERLFHVRGELRPTDDRPLLPHHAATARIAIDPNPGVPAAPFLPHPISLAEVARFAIVLPVLRRCAALAELAAGAFDVLGQPTSALHVEAARRREPPPRRVVWRVRSAAASAGSRVRVVTLTAQHVLAAIGDDASALAGAAWPGGWSDLETAAIGAFAWRRACERDARVQPPRDTVGHHLHVDAAALGRRYRELVDPFAPLLAILRLGCRLHALSPTAVTLELQPRA